MTPPPSGLAPAGHHVRKHKNASKTKMRKQNSMPVAFLLIARDCRLMPTSSATLCPALYQESFMVLLRGNLMLQPLVSVCGFQSRDKQRLVQWRNNVRVERPKAPSYIAFKHGFGI